MTGSSLYSYRIAQLNDEAARLKMPSAHLAQHHFDDHMGILTFGANYSHTRRTLMVWNMLAGTSHTFDVDGCSTPHCDYCEQEYGSRHTLTSIWMSAKFEKAILVYACFPARSPYVYVRVQQTTLDGKITYDKHLEFTLVRCAVPGVCHYRTADTDSLDHAAYRCVLNAASGSDILNVSIGYNALETSFLGGSISFDLNLALDDPLQAEKAKVMFTAHPLSGNDSRPLPYKGLKQGCGAVGTDKSNAVLDRRSRVLCHCFEDEDYTQQIYDYEHARLNAVSTMITTHGGEEESLPLDKRTWKQVAACKAGPLFYYCVSDRPNKAGLRTFSIYVNAVNRPNGANASEVCGSKRVEIVLKDDEDFRHKDSKARMIKSCMSEDFVVVQLVMERSIVFTGLEDLAMFFVVLAFDPNYNVPQWVLSAGEYFQIRGLRANEPQA